MIVKRFFDVLLSSTALVIMLPLIIICTILIYFKLGLPILFTQDRVGIDGKIFRMYKFRTMIDRKNENLKHDQERLTIFGKILRSLSLDELPELINVIKGDMSLVGPRPLLIEYLPLYSERQMKRHKVLPGITGWAQVNGRNGINWERKFELDLWYIENWSLFLDLKIIFMTPIKVIRQENINYSENITAEKFNGTN
jgi:undecaprenyl phosphate N,N'-diacetylbacillosamine 1-phosphate transferase